MIEFRLYIADQTPRSLAAVANLKRLCEAHLYGAYRIEVIDLMVEPARAAVDHVIAIPTLVRWQPTPVRRIAGDLSNERQVLVRLELA